MSALAEVFRTHGAAYCAAGGDAVPARHRAVIDSITHCRTEVLGTLTCSCDECGRLFDIYRSCGNRHCPVCGKAKGREWLAKQLDRLLPVPHFMITFTVPAAFRSGSPLPSLKRQRTSTGRLIAHTTSPKPALPFVPVVPARAMCSSSHRLPLGFIPGSHSQRTSAYKPSTRTQHEL